MRVNNIVAHSQEYVCSPDASSQMNETKVGLEMISELALGKPSFPMVALWLCVISNPNLPFVLCGLPDATPEMMGVISGVAVIFIQL